MSLSSIEKYRERVRSIENTPEFLLEIVKLTFAEELCRLLDEKGMTHGQLAEKLGTSRAYVTRILRTDYNLTAETMVKIARALDARVELALVPKGAPDRARAVASRVSHDHARRRESVAADRSFHARKDEFIASDRPARARRSRKP
jgi:transcriptional regulator with XRE-family HTH domain